MMNLFLVAVGGAAGAVLRWVLGGFVLHQAVGWRFPVSTFAVNVAGCLAAGVLTGLVVRLDALSNEMRLLLFTGLLGGFTTFSAFGIETVALLRRGEIGIASAYVLGSVIAGIGGVWLGMALVPGRGAE